MDIYYRNLVVFMHNIKGYIHQNRKLVKWDESSFLDTNILKEIKWDESSFLDTR